ncbi:MAG: RNA polymerase factor sigma-54 [Proteobacteria bacterium]|nr:RNA polymerase factor sigma-54 [Pseudomonadota bacterium]MBU1641183.1 RNA polymerase factor sigma-54 [Pseudomonadota bacterium]
MALELRQSLKLTQQLVMTPQLQQAIKLLQLSRLELVDTVQQEIEQNPVLEDDFSSLNGETSPSLPEFAPDQIVIPPSERTSEVNLENPSNINDIDWSNYANEYEPISSYRPRGDSDEMPSRLDILSEKPNLQSHLRWQLSLTDLTDEEKVVGEHILGNLSREGFLEAEIAEIAEQCGHDEDDVQYVLEVIQEMDPAGVGARNVQESLLLQLERLELKDKLPAEIIKDHLHLLETKNYIAIARACHRSIDDVVAAISIIVGLDPHPGWAYSDEEPHYITPDVTVQKVDGEYVILLNDDGLPKLKISSYYRDILKKQANAPAATKEYIQDKIRSAAWLIKSIQQRQRTIYRVMESILKFQYDFFENGVAYLKPLVLRDVAEDISMHESTISRVTSNKYAHTPQGTFELKYFFTSSISRNGGGDALSSESIRQRIRQIVQAENPNKPFSDKAIAEIFAKDGIQLARRTVAKYREQLGILSSKFRKNPKLK